MKIRLFIKDIEKLVKEKYPNYEVRTYQYGNNEFTDFFIELEDKEKKE